MADRKVQQISKELADLLIKQIAHELKNHNLYKSFANYFSVQGIVDLEKFFNHRAQEEYNHHQWIIDYLNDADVKVIYPAVEINTEKFEDDITPFKQTVDREILTTQMLYAIHEAALKEQDYMTASWLYKKLIDEQIEEESLSRMSLSIIKGEGDIFILAEKILDLVEM